jgi:MRG-binding protein
MISISENIRNHGYNGYASPKHAHTRIPGIWEKLGTLYNLEALDIRVCLARSEAR